MTITHVGDKESRYLPRTLLELPYQEERLLHGLLNNYTNQDPNILASDLATIAAGSAFLSVAGAGTVGTAAATAGTGGIAVLAFPAGVSLSVGLGAGAAKITHDATYQFLDEKTNRLIVSEGEPANQFLVESHQGVFYSLVNYLQNHPEAQQQIKDDLSSINAVPNARLSKILSSEAGNVDIMAMFEEILGGTKLDPEALAAAEKEQNYFNGKIEALFAKEGDNTGDLRGKLEELHSAHYARMRGNPPEIAKREADLAGLVERPNALPVEKASTVELGAFSSPGHANNEQNASRNATPPDRT